MISIICIGVYIIIGVLMNFFHPEIPELNPVFRSVYRPTIDDYIAVSRYNPKWKRLFAVLLIRVVITTLGPILTIIDLSINAFRKGRKIILREYEEEDYNYLFLFDIAGAGEVSCMLCGYSTKLTGFVDGGPGSDWDLRGLQCQSCGKFREIEFANKIEQLPGCECGGILSRGEYVFCPECRSDHMVYNAQYVDEKPTKPDIYKNLLSHANSVT